MRFIINESQYKRLNENFDQALDLILKLKRGENLKPSEKDIVNAFQKYVKMGGNPEDFEFNIDDLYDVDDREGMRFKYNLKGRPFNFEFSEEVDSGDEIEYYGGISFNGDEYLGVIISDKRGYLIDYDFYNTLSDDDIRLQDVLKNEDSDTEIQHFFQEEVIKYLKK